MEKEKQAKEAEEKAKLAKQKKLEESFSDTKPEWEKDKAKLQNANQQAGGQGAAARAAGVGKEA